MKGALEMSDGEVQEAWDELSSWLESRFGRETGIESVLFLIGIQSTGIGFSPKLGKERKQDLIMRGTYEALATLGLYEEVEGPEDEETNFRRTTANVPKLPISDQERLLKVGILNYFRRSVL